MHTLKIVILSFSIVAFTPYFSHADELVINPASTTVSLRIETATSTLWDGPIEVIPCSPSGMGTGTPSGYCAVEATGLNTTWSTFGEDKFLESVENHANDFLTGAYWGWFSNDVYGQTALTSHTVQDDEKLLLTLGIMPLKIVLASTTAVVFEFGFDSNWNGVWTTSASSTIYSGNNMFCTTSTDGTCEITASSSAFSLYAVKQGFATSSIQTITPTTVTVETEPSPTAPQGGGGTSSTHPVTPKTVNVSDALEFIYSKQLADGSFSGELYNDWTALALSSISYNNHTEKLASFMRSSVPNLSSVTDYERHAMALMSLGINPYSGTPVDCIERIVQAFDGTQMGDINLINDDVFALFPLLKLGYTANDDIIYKTGLHIVSSQKEDGSWNASIDMTSATVSALAEIRTVSGVQNALTRARSYLIQQQQADGGFGSTFSTSWVIQAIIALGESPSSWKNASGKSPLDSLALSQAMDGGLEHDASQGTRLWATSYMIPSVLGRSWSSLLSSFTKPQTPQITSIPVPAQNSAHIVQNNTSTTSLLETPVVIAVETLQPVIVKTTPPVVKASQNEDAMYQNTLPLALNNEVRIPASLAAVAGSNPEPLKNNTALNVTFGIIVLSGISFLVIKIQ